MAEQFSLRWNNYHSNLSSGFHELMQANDMVDVTLAVEGQFLQAHKIVLSICSPLFKQLFKINPCKHPVIILRDVSYNNLKDILAFMYLGEVNVLRDNLSSFLRTAELLQVKGLTGDDSSDTSSKKDKTDSICDNEIEQDMQQFNQLINSSETQLPSSPTLNSTKRTTKSLNLQTKRSKSDTHTNSISTKSESSPTPPQVLEDESEYVQTPNIKHENSSYASENEDMSCTPEQLLDCKSVNRTTLQDSSSQDHVANFGQEWEVSHIRTKTPYRVGTGHEIVADIGVNIGLRSVNVTLKSEPDGPLANEVINYNERFEWAWDQGRFGFGPYAGHLQQQFRAAQYRGTPLPILWVIDYFVIDGEGYRFGRFYRTAGWYTHILVWAAFPCWLLAVILFRSVIRYGAYCLFLCGFLLVFANIIWSVIRNPSPLHIPFEDAVITMKYGASYWLCLCTGIICMILSIVIILMDANYDESISIFFGVDPLTCLDEYILSQSEIQLMRDKTKVTPDIPMSEIQPSTSAATNALVDDLQTVFMKRKSSIQFKGAAQKLRKAHRKRKEDEQPLYGNMETIRKHEAKGDSPSPV